MNWGTFWPPSGCGSQSLVSRSALARSCGDSSFLKLLQFSILLNVNLAIFNLLPLLPLDGGKILMGVLRQIHQPLRKLELPLTVAGCVLLLGLTIYATVLDISRVAHGMLG